MLRWIAPVLFFSVAASAQVPDFGGGGVPNQIPGVQFLGTPIPGDCVKIVSIGPPVTLTDAGAPCGSGGGCQGKMDLSAGCALLVAGYGGLF